MEIKKVTLNLEQYMELLLIADPDEAMVRKYLEKSDVFTAIIDDRTVGIIVIIKVDDEKCELINVAVAEDMQGKGIGSALVRHIIAYYKGKYKTMCVGTGNSSVRNIPFYESFGFVHTSTIKNFFVDNYSEPIFEDGIQCVDMLRFEMPL